MRVAVFGGSFDPPHIAHVMLCRHVLATGAVDRVLMIPCACHPFGKRMAAFERRLAMCRLAVEGIDNIDVSDIEGAREGVSYMVDTLEELSRQRPNDTFRLVVGSDILSETKQWKDFDRIERLAPLLVVPRLDETTREKADDAYQLPEVSSTEVRERLAGGKSAADRLSPRVADYIRQHGLYGPEE